MSEHRIATVLEDGTYGERDMTAEEIAEFEAIIAVAPVVELPRIERPMK